VGRRATGGQVHRWNVPAQVRSLFAGLLRPLSSHSYTSPAGMSVVRDRGSRQFTDRPSARIWETSSSGEEQPAGYCSPQPLAQVAASHRWCEVASWQQIYPAIDLLAGRRSVCARISAHDRSAIRCVAQR
jgi:hypothetical protein